MTAYVLIDFENVQPKELGAFGGGGHKVMVFVGQGQSSMPVSLTSALLDLKGAGEIVQIDGRGPNALDMHIAYYIGRLAASDPGAAFHIISRDRDYDPLIRHLQMRHIECTRWKSIAEINAARLPAPAAHQAHTPKGAHKPTAKAAPTKTATKPAAKTTPKTPARAAPIAAPHDRVAEIADNLARRTRGLPATLKALASTVKAHFRGEGVTDGEVDGILLELEKRGLVGVKDGKVSYRLTRL